VTIELHAFFVIRRRRILHQTLLLLPSTYTAFQRVRGIGNIEMWHLTTLSMAKVLQHRTNERKSSMEQWWNGSDRGKSKNLEEKLSQ